MTENRVDLSPFNLLIATPMATGRPEDEYNTAVEKLKYLIHEHGGKCERFKIKYVSDVYYARSRLFGTFMRAKEFTHMIMIDDDMGFDPVDVVWMLLLQRDMVAAVGVKKKFPIEFAWNLHDENGKQWPVEHELDTNVCKVPFVGAAFMLISRNCAERIAASYPELEYDLEENVEYSVFDSIIVGRRRLSEDYAFCLRWRKIGGDVFVKMDITLTHTGSYTFTGNLLETLMNNQPNA